MKAMLVEVNGRRVCLASLAGKGEVHTNVRWLRKDDHEGMLLTVMGIDGREAAIWPTSPIEIGDEVRIKIVETEKADSPIKESTKVRPASR